MKQDPIVFVTHISYLDGAVEHIELASKACSNFNVIITLSPTQIFRNIVDLRHVDFNADETIVDFNDIKEDWQLELFAPYFENCKNVSFLIYHKPGMLNAISVTRKFNRHIRNLKPKYIHFDSYINRQIFQLPFLYSNRKKIILNVHDAKPHSGEEENIRIVLQRYLYRWCAKFVTFSDFSKVQLEEQLIAKKQVISSFLLPFSFYKNYVNKNASVSKKPKKISFVGRVSKYKGIDLFIDGINLVHKTMPDAEFVIAGRSFGNYVPGFDRIENREKVTIIQEHLSNIELVEIITDSQLIVCPYLDASQSGVVVTAIALDRPVLVTEAGGLKEYITEGTNGMISKIDAVDLASKIIRYCEQNRFEEMNNKMKSDNYNVSITENYISVLNDMYS